ncbi:hypothetical protein R5R35_003030 [Gryllus longicercus]|uniref:Uncharacterized protein n=1 Tax=Gryllus longicercus TaxID=2509291 RepID=A0AAN9ZAN7_9ORTH
MDPFMAYADEPRRLWRGWRRAEEMGAAWHREAADAQVPAARPAGPPLPWWTHAHDARPQRPVRAGTDLDGGPLYVGRAWHQSQLLPAKVAPKHQGAFVAWKGREHSKFFMQFEVLHLLRGRAEWIEASDGDIPAQAFPVGITSSGRQAFAARASVQGVVTPGRIVEGDNCCYVPYGHKEWAFENYEVLAIL